MEKSDVTNTWVRATKAKAKSMNCPTAARSPNSIIRASLRAAPIIGMTACSKATQKARIRAICPSSALMRNARSGKARAAQWGSGVEAVFAAAMRAYTLIRVMAEKWNFIFLEYEFADYIR